VRVLDVAMTPPAGRERLFAVWSHEPLRLDQLAGLAGRGETTAPYRATRDMRRVADSFERLRPEDRHVVVVEVDHVPW
jgi:hypothetical protein